MRNRTYKSLKDELVKKSREAMLAAVQVYNNPNITFKSECYITLAIISWTYLIHAYYRQQNIDYRYYSKHGKKKVYDKTKSGAFKYWELEKCLSDSHCPFDKETILNLKFLIGVRHEIEHQMTSRIDEAIGAKLQACCINYAEYICNLFGEKYDIRDQLAFSLQFSPISPEQTTVLQDNAKLSSNIKNYIADFENVLSEEEFNNPHYAYRLFFVPKKANHKGQADKVIEFIPADSEEAKGLNHQYAIVKETEKNKYLPSDIVRIMKNEGYSWFTMGKHTQLWQSLDGKNPSKHYGVCVAGKTWYWYESWLDQVREYCSNEQKR